MYPKYEFKQQPLSDKGKRTLAHIYRLFANQASSALSSFFHIPVSLSFESLEQIPFSLYLASLAHPALGAILSMPPLNGKAIIEINPQLSYSAMSLMLGGEGDVPHFFPPMNALEMAAHRKFINTLLKILEETWKPLVDLELTISEISSLSEESDLSMEPSYLIARFNAHWKSTIGSLTFGLPTASLESIYSTLEELDFDVDPQPIPSSIDLDRIEIELKAKLGTIYLSKEDLKTFKLGDILLLEQNIHHPIDIVSQEQIPFKGMPGLIGTHKGIYIKLTKESIV